MKRILFVAMPDSVHSARWIRQITGQGWEIHLFPVSAARLHPIFRESGVIVHGAMRDRVRRYVKLDARWPMHVRGVHRLRRSVVEGQGTGLCGAVGSVLTIPAGVVAGGCAKCLAAMNE